MLLTTFLPLCVGEIYVAMAARRQWERTVAPVGGNITFAYESSERSQESDEPGSECQGLVATSFGRSQSASAFAFISRSTSA